MSNRCSQLLTSKCIGSGLWRSANIPIIGGPNWRSPFWAIYSNSFWWNLPFDNVWVLRVSLYEFNLSKSSFRDDAEGTAHLQFGEFPILPSMKLASLLWTFANVENQVADWGSSLFANACQAWSADGWNSNVTLSPFIIITLPSNSNISSVCCSHNSDTTSSFSLASTACSR